MNMYTNLNISDQDVCSFQKLIFRAHKLSSNQLYKMWTTWEKLFYDGSQYWFTLVSPVVQKWVKHVKPLQSELHAFIIVIKVDQFTEEEKYSLK